MENIWTFEDCITKDGISDQCVTNVGGNKFNVNENITIITKGQLVQHPNLPYATGRSINTDFKLGDTFYYSKGKIQSECVTPIHMEYANPKLYDFHKPTSALRQGTNNELVLNQLICSKDYFRTFVNDYNRV